MQNAIIGQDQTTWKITKEIIEGDTLKATSISVVSEVGDPLIVWAQTEPSNVASTKNT